MKIRTLTIVLMCISQLVFGNEIHISGTVLNEEGKPLPYVNISIQGKKLGCISDVNGNFMLKIKRSLVETSDKILFSCIGYATKYFQLDNFWQEGYVKVVLEKKVEKIPAVRISGETKKTKTRGTTHFPLPLGVHLALADCPDQNLGAAIGRTFRIKHASSKLKKLRFYLYLNNYDTVVFRLAFYKSRKRKPGKPLIQEPVYIKITDKKTGWITIHLEEYNICLNGKVILALEWVDKSSDGNTLSFPLARPSLASHYYKHGVDNKWERWPGMSALMELTFTYKEK